MREYDDMISRFQTMFIGLDVNAIINATKLDGPDSEHGSVTGHIYGTNFTKSFDDAPNIDAILRGYQPMTLSIEVFNVDADDGEYFNRQSFNISKLIGAILKYANQLGKNELFKESIHHLSNIVFVNDDEISAYSNGSQFSFGTYPVTNMSLVIDQEDSSQLFVRNSVTIHLDMLIRLMLAIKLPKN